MSDDIVDVHDLPCGHSAKYAIFGGDNGCLGCTAERIGKERDALAAENERLRARLAEVERERGAACSMASAHEQVMDWLRARLTEAEREVKDSREAEDYAKTAWHEAEAQLVEALAYWFSDANPTETPFAAQFDAFRERQP